MIRQNRYRRSTTFAIEQRSNGKQKKKARKISQSTNFSSETETKQRMNAAQSNHDSFSLALLTDSWLCMELVPCNFN